MENRRKESWHVGKEIPLALLFAIFLQTAGAIWWAASFSATVTQKLDNLSYQVASLTADKYSQHDAARDFALVDEKMQNLNKEITQLKEEVKWLKQK